MTFLFQCTALVGQVFAFVFTVRLLRLAGRPKAGAYFIAAMGLLLIRSLIAISQPDPQADQNQFALYGELCLTLFALFAALGAFLLRTHVRTQVLARWTPGDPASEYSEIGVEAGSPTPTAPAAPTMDEGDAQILCNSSMEVTELNQAAARLLGRDRQDFYGKSIATFVRREEMLLVPELFREVAGGMASSSEWNFRKPDETLVAVRIAPRSHFNDQVRLILQDLTEERERQRTDVDSGKQDSIMAQLLDAASDGYIAYDSDLKVIGWNRAMENMSGVHRSQCMNQHLLIHFQIPEELAEEDFVQEALEGHTHDLTGTELVNSKTGESETVNYHFGPLANSAGEIIGGMIQVSKSAVVAPASVSQEIAAEPEAETPITLETPAVEEPRKEETTANISMPESAIPTAIEIDKAALRAMRILQAAPQLISTFDLMAHRETYANRALAVELGFAPDLVETMGDNVLGEIVHPEDQHNLPRHAEEWLGASEGERRITEYRVADPDQNWHWFQTTDTPFDRNEDGVVTSIVSITEDITVRKELELQLRKSEQEQQSAAAPMPEPEPELPSVPAPELGTQPEPDQVIAAEMNPAEPTIAGPVPIAPAINGYVTYDHDLKITGWNEGMTEFTGTQIEQCIGQIVQMHLPIPDELAEEDYILEALEGHSETIEDASVLNPKTGEEESFKYKFGPLSDLDGNVVGGFVRVTSHVAEPAAEPAPEPESIDPEPAADIPMPALEETVDAPITIPAEVTPTKLAVSEPAPIEPPPVDEEAELAKSILAAAPQLVTAFNLTDRRQIYANRELAAQLGFPREQIDALGDDVLEELVHPEDQRNLLRRAEQWADAGEHEQRTTEYRLSDPERRWHWFQSTDAVLERDTAGKVTSIVSITEEITERKEQERQLRLAEQKYRTFSEHCPTGIWHITAGGQTHYLNPAMCELLGAASPADIEGYTYQRFLTKDSQQSITQQINSGSDTSTFEIDIQRLDGSIRHCILHGAPELDSADQIRNLMGSIIDVTERAEADRLLCEQEARYRAIVEQTPDLICRFDQAGRLSFINGAYCEFFGQTRDELLGGPFAPKIPEMESEVVIEMLSTLDPAMEPRQFNCRLFRADNEERATRWTLHAVSDDSGSFIEYQAVACDVTETIAAEQALVESEEKFRGIFEQTNVGIFLVDTEGRFTAMNKAYAQMTGRPESELLGNVCTIISHPDSHEQSMQLLGAVVSGEIESAEMANRYILPDESEAWVELTARAIRDGQGKVIHLICIAKDVTDSRNSLAALENSERKHRHLIEHHPFAIVVTDQNRIIFENPAAEPLFGRAEDDQERTLAHILPQESVEEISRCVEQAIEQDEDTELHEATFKNADGSEFAAEFAAMPVEFEGTIAAQLVIRDITARKTVEDALRRSETQLREKEALLMTAINNLPFDLWACDLDSRYTLQNNSSKERWGDRIGKKPEETSADPEIVKLWHENNHRALQGETVFEHVRYHHEQDLRDFQSIVGPIRQDDKVVGFLGANIDITDLKKAESRLAEVEAKLQATESSSSEVAAELRELKTTLDERETSLLVAEESRDAFKSDFEKSDADLNIAKAAHSEAESDRDLAQGLLKEAETELSDIKATLEETKAQLEEARQSLEEKEAVRLEVETTQSSTAEELAKVSALLVEAEESRDAYQADFEKADADLNTAKSAQSEAESDRDLAQGLLKETEADLADTKATLEETQAQLEEARQSLEEKETARLEVETSHTSTAEELAKVSTLLAAAETAREDSKTEVEALQSKLDEATKANEDTQAELDLTKEALSEAETARAKAETKSNEARTTLSEKDTAVRQVEQSRAELESELEKTKQALTDTESERAKAIESVAKTESDLESANSTIAEFEGAQSSSQTKLSEAEAKAGDLQSQLDELRTKLTEAELARDEAKEELATAEAAKREFEKALKETSNKLSETESLYYEFKNAQSETANKLSEIETARDEANKKIEALELSKTEAEANVTRLQSELHETNERLSSAENAESAADSPPPVQIEVPAENLVNELPEMVWMSTAEGERGFFNEAWLEFTGRTLDEARGNHWRDAIHGQDRDGVIRTIQRAIEDHESFAIEYRLRAADGSYRWVEDAGVPRKNSEGEVTDYLGSTHDITTQIRREEELKAGMRQLEWAQSRAKLGSWEYRPRGDHRQWSRQTFKLYNQSPNDGTPETYEDFLQLIHDEDRDKLRRANEKVLKTGQPLSNLEYRTNPETGPVRYLSASTYRIPEQDGSAYYLGGTVMDITEQKAAAENVRRGEERYRKIIEVAEEGVWMMDMEGYTSFVNPRMMRMLGYKYREFIGRHFFEFLESESLKEAEEYMERREKGITEQAEFTFLRKNGQPVNVLITSSTLADADGDYVGVLSFVSDITERKAAATLSSEAQREMASILACVPNLVLTVDPKRIVQYASREHAGMNAGQITGTPALNWIAPDHRESFETAIDSTFESGDPRQVEVEGLGSDGTQVQYRCHLSPVGDGDNPDSVAIVFASGGQAVVAPEAPARTESDDQLAALTQKLFATDEAERRRIANELHDQFGQALSVAMINLQALAKTKQTAKNQERLQGSLESLESLIERVRKLSEELRPSILDDLGLEAALRWLVDQQADSAGFAAEFKADKIDRLEADKESALFRITEAALDNIARHAGAKKVSVALTKADKQLTLTIDDNGAGFDAGAVSHGIGLPSMEQRARLIGAEFSIQRGASGGSSVEVSFPLPRTKPKAKAKTKRRRKKK